MDRNKVKIWYNEQIEDKDRKKVEKALDRFYLLPSIVPGREPLKRKIYVDSLTSCFIDDYYESGSVPTFVLEDGNISMYEIIGKKYSI
ncbi:MAG: hypothetical protein AABX93_02670 [Nanoarchaeota archaeon]